MRDETERVLRAAGWCPGRSHDTSAARSALESDGYRISARVEEFLREFDGISVRYKRGKDTDFIRFDARDACSGADSAWVHKYENRTWTSSMVPIGESNSGHLLLVMSSDGTFFGGFDDVLVALGSSAEEMIEKLLNQDQERLRPL